MSGHPPVLVMNTTGPWRATSPLRGEENTGDIPAGTLVGGGENLV